MVIERKRVVVPKDDWHRKYYWDMRKVAHNCARCSVCKWIDLWETKSARFAKICPSSQRYLFDAYSCQGKMDIAIAMMDGELKYEDSPGLLDVIYKCQMGGGCDAMCKRVQDMEPLEVMLELRSKCVEDGQLLPAFVPLIEGLRKEDNMMQRPKAERGKWAEGLGVKDLTKEKAEVVFHAGCRLSFDEELWKVARGAVTLLKNAGVDVGIFGAEEVCCGGRPYEMGYQGELTKYADHNIEAFKTAGVKTLVTPCSDCYQAFKVRYPRAGKDLGIEVLHIAEYLERLIKEGKIKLTKEIPMRVTYHDPCHLGRLSTPYVPGEAIGGVYEEPREILRKMPRIELVEMERTKENAWCCGAGGGVKEAYPDFAIWTAAERIEEANATGAEAIVTACPWCERNFIDTVKEMGEGIKVYDIVELVQQAI